MIRRSLYAIRLATFALVAAFIFWLMGYSLTLLDRVMDRAAGHPASSSMFDAPEQSADSVVAR